MSILTNFQIDAASIVFQIMGAWVAGIQVIQAYNKNPIENFKQSWSGNKCEIIYTNEFQRFTKRMRLIFIIGISLITIGLLLPLMKYQIPDKYTNQNHERNTDQHIINKK